MVPVSPSQLPFLDYRHYLRERYGGNLHRIPIDLGFGCPQRRLDGSGGCAFCGPDAGRAAHLHPGMDPAAQVAAGLRVARERSGGTRYIAYFQAGTSTHAPPGAFRERVGAALAAADFPVVVFATRPDCLPAAILDVLAELGGTHEVWVELGVQTSHDATLARVNRGHDFATSVRAAAALHGRGIAVAAHVILGLPGEGPAEFAITAQRLREAPFSGIKIHNLHIVRGSAFESLWRRGDIEVMDEHAYAEALMAFLRHIPGTWPVMRLAADTPAQQLLAPRWWMDKSEFRHYVVAQMRQRAWTQGDLAPPATPVGPAPGVPAAAARTQRLLVGDLPWERRRLSSALTGLLEAVTVRPVSPARGALVLALGFGHGPLALDGLDVLPTRLSGRVLIHGLADGPGALARQRPAYPDYAGLLRALELRGRCRRTWGRVAVHWGDPRQTIMRLSGRADIVILEPDRVEDFPCLFTLDFLRRVVRLMPPGAVLLSACSSPALRGALLRLGLAVGHGCGAAPNRGGTVAAWSPASLHQPLPADERRGALGSTGGLPYRDRALNWTPSHILGHHERLRARMQARGMPASLAGDAGPATGDVPA